jgi:hypothetical protein
LLLDFSILASTIPTIVFGERTQLDAVRRAWEDLAQSSALAMGHAAAAARAAQMPRYRTARRWRPYAV